MSFSRSQHVRLFRPMVDRAWAAHCRRECITESTPASKRAWYEAQLERAFAVNTSKKLDRRRDFEKAMALFEELLDDGSTEWQLKYIGGDAKRARFNLDSTITTLRLTPDYIAAIADRMGVSPRVRDLTAQQALDLRIALLTHVGRQQRRHLDQERREAPPA